MTAPERLNPAEVQRVLTCFHEAAHVSLCMLYEIPFDFVTLVTGFWGGVRSGYVRMKGDEEAEKIENEIVMAFAGLAAEEHWFELNPGYGSVNPAAGAGDTADSRRMITEYQVSVSEVHLRRRALAVVITRWEHITRLASVLDQRRRLNAAQARRAG